MNNGILRINSFGGGWQSVAMLALQGQGKLPQPYDVYVFANVGNDSENPDTLAYVRDHVLPYCAAHGIQFVEVQKCRRNKELDTVLTAIERRKRSVVIPVKLGKGGRAKRSCTPEFKIDVIDAWIRGLEPRPERVEMGINISTDEWKRAKDRQWHNAYNETPLGFWKRRDYQMLDLNISRDACPNIIARAGLPMPPKSSCWFCPFKRPNEWIQMQNARPDLFQKAIALEETLNAKGLHDDAVYCLHRAGVPLKEAVSGQMEFDFTFDDDNCDEGVCMV